MAGLKVFNYQEPDYTAGVTLNLPKVLNLYCRTHKVPVSFGGCFTHQSPKVSFNDGNNYERTCELADLLLMAREYTSGQLRYNSAFLQTKMTDSTGCVYVTGQGSVNQYTVYTQWPLLSWKYGTPKNYDIRPRTITEGAKYLLINKAPLSFSISEPKKAMNMRGKDFSDYLYDFICWNAGRAIVTDGAPHLDDWSKLVWDTLDRLTVFNRRKVGIVNQTRKGGDLFNLLLSKQTIDMVANGGSVDDGPLGLLFIDIRE